MNQRVDRVGIGTHVLASAFAAAIGAGVGFVTTFTHLGLAPGGLVAGLVISVALVAGFRLVFGSRIIGGAAALGSLVAVALLALPGASGTLVVFDNPLSVIWMIAPPVLAAVVLAWPVRGGASGGRQRSI